jgi:branched-chain amino acid aminotransferase
MGKVWINGKFYDSDRAKISVFDRGFMYGDGAFETMRSYAGTVFRLDDHIGRLATSLGALGIRPPCSGKALASTVYRALKANGLKNAYIKVVVTRGEGRFGIGYKDRLIPSTVVVAKDFEGYPEWMFSEGLTASIAGLRQNELSILSRVKSLSFLGYILARFEAKDMGYDEAILLNTKGTVAEAATSNVFIVKDGSLATPSLLDGVLPGVTRACVMTLAKKAGIKTSERAVKPGELMAADEVFLTNSLAEILPVTRVGRARIGNGRPGEITKLLRISYQMEVIREVLARP